MFVHDYNINMAGPIYVFVQIAITVIANNGDLRDGW